MAALAAVAALAGCGPYSHAANQVKGLTDFGFERDVMSHFWQKPRLFSDLTFEFNCQNGALPSSLMTSFHN